MNQGQFNELMNELRGIATKLDRLLDGQTKANIPDVPIERGPFFETPPEWRTDGMDGAAISDLVKREVLTPDKPKASKKAK